MYFTFIAIPLHRLCLLCCIKFVNTAYLSVNLQNLLIMFSVKPKTVSVLLYKPTELTYKGWCLFLACPFKCVFNCFQPTCRAPPISRWFWPRRSRLCSGPLPGRRSPWRRKCRRRNSRGRRWCRETRRTLWVYANENKSFCNVHLSLVSFSFFLSWLLGSEAGTNTHATGIWKRCDHFL